MHVDQIMVCPTIFIYADQRVLSRETPLTGQRAFGTALAGVPVIHDHRGRSIDTAWPTPPWVFAGVVTFTFGWVG
ncbi:MAG TPA: hypothetical protein VHV10_02045 [Ktedonobacteraceae bacterium]|nr:hypothetical protein [Ktedonobacteraceae bacterium]